MERRQGVLGLALGQVDGAGVDAAGPQPVDERRHARRRPARAVTQEQAQTHRGSVALSWVVRMGPWWSGRVMAGPGGGPPSFDLRITTSRTSLAPRSRSPRPLPPPPRDLGAGGARHRPCSSRSVAGSASAAVPVPTDGPPAQPGRRRPRADAHPALARRADRPRADRHVPRPRLRSRRRDVAVRRPRPGARRPEHGRHPRATTTGARPSARSIRAPAIRVRVLSRFKVSQGEAAGRLRAPTDWSIDGIARRLPARAPG